MSSQSSQHRRHTNTQHLPHGRDVFGVHGNCRCQACVSYRTAVRRLVDGFSQLPQRWVMAVADYFETPLAVPMWGTLFLPNDPCDARHIERLLKPMVTTGDCDLQALRATGWRQVADTGVLACRFDDELLLGIHGAGYDFYSQHWEPLYAALGYRWHE